jgi:hypothetical protein
VAVDAAGNIYIADTNNNRMRMVVCGTGLGGCKAPSGKTSGYIYTVAGTGTAGYNGDGLTATSAELNQPFGVVADPAGNIYIADTDNHRIRMIVCGSGLSGCTAPSGETSGYVYTVAGDGTAGYNGDNVAATGAELNGPTGVALDTALNIYIDDQLNNRIRAVGHQ